MILVAGDIMLDVLLLPELQAEEQGGGLVIRGGGSAANTAAWLGATEADVTFVGCVGNDPAGAMLRAELTQSGVSVDVRTVAEETGCVAVDITAEGERVMRSSRGANQRLEPDDLTRAARDQKIDVIHLTGYALLGPSGLDLLDMAAMIAMDHGAFLSFDPSSLGVIGHVGPDTLLDALTEAGVQLFLPNAAEAEALTGERDPVTMAAQLALRFKQVAVKMGPEGAIAAERGQAWKRRTTPVVPVDTTGAGDAFNAGVLRGLVTAFPFPDTVDDGNRLAGECVGRYGARPLNPDREDPRQ